MASLWDNIVNHGLWGGAVETVKDAVGKGELTNPAKFTVIDANGDKTEVANAAAGPIYKTPTGYSASRSFAYLTQGDDGKLTFTYSKSLADSDTFKKNYLENDTFKEIVRGYNANSNASTPITTTKSDGTTETVPYSQLIENYNTALGEFATGYEGYSGIRDTIKNNTGFNLTDDEVRIVANSIDPKEKNSETKIIFLPDEWTQIHDFSKLDSWDAETKTVSAKDFFSEFNLDKEGGINEEEWNEMMGAANGVISNAYSGNMKRNVDEDADGDEEVEAKARDRLARSMSAATLLNTYDPEQNFWHTASIVGSNAVLEFTNFFAQAANNVATLEATAFDYIGYGVDLGAAYVTDNVFNGILFGAASEDIASGAVNGNVNEYINGILVSSTDGSMSEVERVKAEFKAKVAANETLATFATTDENKLVAFDEAVDWHETYTAQIAPKAALAGQITGQLVALAVEVAIANGVGKAAETAVGAVSAKEALATGFAKGTALSTRLKALATFALKNKFAAFSANMLTQAIVDTLAFEKNSDFVAAFERLDKGEQDALTSAFMDNLVGNTVAEVVGIGSSAIGGKIAASENPAIRFVNARVTKAVNTLSLPKKKMQLKFAESKIAQFLNQPLGTAGKASRQATDMAIKALNEEGSTLFKAQTLEEWNIEKAKIEYEATRNIARAKKGVEYIADFEKNTTKISETTTEAILGKASEKTNFLNQASRVVEGVKTYANEIKMNPAISTAMKNVSQSVNEFQKVAKWSDFNPSIGKSMSQESANYVAHKAHYDDLVRKQGLRKAEGLKLSAGDASKLTDLENWLNAFNASHNRAIVSALDNIVEKQRAFYKALTDWQVTHGVFSKSTYDSLIKTKIFGKNDELYVRTIALPEGKELYDMSDEEFAKIFKESDSKLNRFSTGTRDVDTIFKQDLHLGHGVDRNYLDPMQVNGMTIDSVAKAYQGKMWYNSLTSIKAPIRTLDTDGKPLKSKELKAATEHAKNAATESLGKIASDDLKNLGPDDLSLTGSYDASRTEDVYHRTDKKTGKDIEVRTNRVEAAQKKVEVSKDRVNSALGIKDDAQVIKNVGTLTPAQTEDIISQFGAEAPQYGKAKSKAQLKAQYESLSEAQKKQALNAMGKNPIEQTKTVDGKIKNENYEAELNAWNNEKAAYEEELKAWKEEKAAYDKQKKAYDDYTKKAAKAKTEAKSTDDSKMYESLFNDLNDASISQLKLDVKDAVELDAEDAAKAIDSARADELELALREDLDYKEFLKDVREFANTTDGLKKNSDAYKEARKKLIDRYIDPEYLKEAKAKAGVSEVNKTAEDRKIVDGHDYITSDVKEGYKNFVAANVSKRDGVSRDAEKMVYEFGYVDGPVAKKPINKANKALREGKKSISDIAESLKKKNKSVDDIEKILSDGSHKLTNDTIVYRVVSTGGNTVNKGDMKWLSSDSGEFSDPAFMFVTLDEQPVLKDELLYGSGDKYVLRVHAPEGTGVLMPTYYGVKTSNGGEFILTPNQKGNFVKTGEKIGDAEYVDVYLDGWNAGVVEVAKTTPKTKTIKGFEDYDFSDMSKKEAETLYSKTFSKVVDGSDYDTTVVRNEKTGEINKNGYDDFVRENAEVDYSDPVNIATEQIVNSGGLIDELNEDLRLGTDGTKEIGDDSSSVRRYIELNVSPDALVINSKGKYSYKYRDILRESSKVDKETIWDDLEDAMGPQEFIERNVSLDVEDYRKYLESLGEDGKAALAEVNKKPSSTSENLKKDLKEKIIDVITPKIIDRLKTGTTKLSEDTILYRIVGDDGNAAVGSASKIGWLGDKSGEYFDKGASFVTLDPKEVLDSNWADGNKYVLRIHAPEGTGAFTFGGSVLVPDPETQYLTLAESNGYSLGGELALAPGQKGKFVKTGEKIGDAEYIDVYLDGWKMRPDDIDKIYDAAARGTTETDSLPIVADPGKFEKAKPTFDKKKPTKTIEGKKQQVTRKAFDVDEPGAMRAWNQAVSETTMVDDLNKTYIRERVAPEEGSDIKKMSKKTRDNIEEYIANNTLRSWTPEGMAESGVEDFSTEQQKLDTAKEKYDSAVKGLKEAKQNLKDAKAMAKRVLEGTDPFSNAVNNIVEMSVDNGVLHLKGTSYAKELEAMAKEAGADVGDVYKHYTLSGMIKIDSDGSVKLNNDYKKAFRDMYEKRILHSINAEVGKVKLSPGDARKMIDEATKKIEERVAAEWRQSMNALSNYPSVVDTEKTFAAIEGEMKNIINDVNTNRNVVQILDKDGEFKFVEVDPLIADLYRSRPYMLQGNDSLMRKLNKLARLSNTTFNPKSWVNQSFKDPIQSVIMAGWAHSIKTYQREIAEMYGDQLVKYLQETMTEAGWEEFSKGLSESELKLKAAKEMTIGVQGSGSFAGDLTQNKFYADQIVGDDWISKTQAAGIQGKAQMGNPYSKKKAAAAQKRAKQGFIDSIAEKSPGGKFNDKREIYFRKANYTAAFNDALKRGQTVEQARATAELVSRNATTNFSNTFMWGNWICNNVPFLSAAINGSASFWRLFEMDPVGISTRIAGAGIAMIAQVISSGQTLEDRQTLANISDSVKRNNIVIVRNGEAFKIPLPEEVCSFLAPFRQAAEKMLGSEDRSWVELLYNDALDLSPIDLDGFSTEDQTALTKNEGLMSRLSRQTQVMISQLTPPIVQTAIIGVTGVDPYTGNTIDNSYTWYDEDGNKQTYNYTQSEFAKWFASVANNLGWNVSADMSEALLEKAFGTGLMTFADSITDLGNSMVGDAIAEPFKVGSSALTVYDSQMQDQYDKDWRNMVKQLEKEKNELLSSDGDYVDAVSELAKLKTTDDNYETKKKNLTRNALQPIEDYRKKVLDMVTTYVNHYGSDYDGSKFASVVSLLNFYTPTTIPTTALDFQREHEAYYDSRDDAYQTMIDMGFSSPSAFSILGEAKRNKETGEIYTRFYSPTAILNAGNAVWSNAGKAINAEIAAALDVADIDRGEMFEGYYAAKAQGNNAAKQYKKDWNAKVVKAVYPVIKQYGPNIVLGNSTVKDYLDNYIFVSNPYKSEEYFKEIFGVEDQ